MVFWENTVEILREKNTWYLKANTAGFGENKIVCMVNSVVYKANTVAFGGNTVKCWAKTVANGKCGKCIGI